MTLGNRLTAAAVLRSGHAKPALLAGAGLLTLGTAAFFTLDAATPPAWMCVWLLIAGRTGPATGGITIATQNCVPHADMGTATAGSALTKQIGGAFGLACGQSLMSYHATPTAAIGSTIAWSGATAGLLAFAALLLMRNIAIPTPASRRIEPAARTATPTTDGSAA
ncbi:hypothetical protein [Kitasatospora sp. GP82]|uniref:hypothetical protein n=1 Tax=Kitasatospora sp. GP82 TaxID=3035089 RepID=UPI002476F1A8|nr:hypothetical protein [Kitasatospora sp. GP82]